MFMKEERGIYYNTPENPSRRRFLTRTLPGGLLTVGSLTALSSCGDEKSASSTPTSETPSPTEPKKSRSFLRYENITLLIEDGLPVNYTVSPTDMYGLPFTVDFDQTEVTAKRNEAINSGAPQIVNILEAGSTPKISTYSREHPFIKDLPSDTLPDEEVAQRGVRIIQGKDTHLSVRKAAFEPGGPLDAFNSTGRKLRIILVDGPTIHSNYMQDPKYTKEVLASVKRSEKPLPSTEEMRQSLMDQTQALLTASEGYKTLLSPTEFATIEASILKNMAIAQRLTVETAGEITDRYIASLPGRAAGQYDQFFLRDEEAVFVSAGSGKTTKNLIIGFGSDGNLLFPIDGTPYLSDYRPKPENTYPNPNDFELNPQASPDNPDSYPYAGQSIGFVLLHELMHDRLTEQQYLKKMKENHSEYDTDMAAMDIVRNGSTKWVDSGFTDNSGYYFAFNVPQEFGGGYIITKKLGTPTDSSSI